MAKPEPTLRAFAKSVLKKAGLEFNDIARHAAEIVVFGSRAAGVQSPKSDLDLLCVSSSPGRRLKVAGLDLLWIRPEVIESAAWLGSELAGHIAAHGRWLHGGDDWKAEVVSSPAAVEKKRRQLQDRIQALGATWNELSDPYRRRLFTLVRRDLQRLVLLESGGAVPPTPLLDRDWGRTAEPMQSILDWLPRVTPLTDREMTRFVSHASELLSAKPRPIHESSSNSHQQTVF